MELENPHLRRIAHEEISLDTTDCAATMRSRVSMTGGGRHSSQYATGPVTIPAAKTTTHYHQQLGEDATNPLTDQLTSVQLNKSTLSTT